MIIPTGEKNIIDFSEVERGGTLNLEACVAVAARVNNTIPLMHVTQKSNFADFFTWFRTKVPMDTARIYLVGGMNQKSESFVDYLRNRLSSLRYNPPTEDVLGIRRRDLWFTLYSTEVHYRQEQRTPHEGTQFLIHGTKTI
jgi:hypothetical protein